MTYFTIGVGAWFAVAWGVQFFKAWITSLKVKKAKKTGPAWVGRVCE